MRHDLGSFQPQTPSTNEPSSSPSHIASSSDRRKLYCVVIMALDAVMSRWLLAITGFCLLWVSLLAVLNSHKSVTGFSPKFPSLKNFNLKIKPPAALSSLSSSAHASQNRTMGFGEILMMILPERTDQIDAASLMSYYSDVDITIIDGVREVVEKTRPPGSAQNTPAENNCWRAHMNAIRHVVDNRLETALIMEADADWDVRIKDQLESLARNMPGATATEPYGLDWMMIWLGTSLHVNSPDRLGPSIKYYDKTVGTVEDSGYEHTERGWIEAQLKLYNASDHERLVHRAFTPFALSSYIVTLEGARHILYQLGLVWQGGPVDYDMWEAVHRGELNGLVVVPPLMAQWKTGNSAKDSDITPQSDSGSPSSGPFITQSIRAGFHDLTFAQDASLDWADRKDLKV